MRWLPATGYDPLETAGILGWPSHLVLPVLVLTCGSDRPCFATDPLLDAGCPAKPLRAGGACQRFACSDCVLRRHALPNALLPTITMLAIDAGILMGGVVVIETVFAYPGLGRLLVFCDRAA